MLATASAIMTPIKDSYSVIGVRKKTLKKPWNACTPPAGVFLKSITRELWLGMLYAMVC